MHNNKDNTKMVIFSIIYLKNKLNTKGSMRDITIYN